MHSAILDCLACRNRGEIELRPDFTVVSKAYEYLGTSIASGYLYLLCKHCKTVLLVDPAGVIGSETEKVKGVVCREGELLCKRPNEFSDSEKPC